jgi:hypothetical protein
VKHVSLPQEAGAQVAAVSDGALRAGPFVGIPQLLRDLGQDPTAVFAAAGCDLHVLDDPENVVSFIVAGRLLDACVKATDCPYFGLFVGQQNGVECLGLVGALAQHSPTLNHALRNIVLHLHLHDRGAVPTLSVADGKATLGYIVYEPGVTAPAALKHDVQRSILARVDGRCEKSLSQIAHRQRKSTLAG